MRWYNGWDGVNDVDDGLLLWLQMVIYMMIFIVPRTYVYIYIYLGTMSSFREGNPCILSAKKNIFLGLERNPRFHLLHVLSNRHQFLHLLDRDLFHVISEKWQWYERRWWWKKCFIPWLFRFLNLQTFHIHSVHMKARLAWQWYLTHWQ